MKSIKEFILESTMNFIQPAEAEYITTNIGDDFKIVSQIGDGKSHGNNFVVIEITNKSLSDKFDRLTIHKDKDFWKISCVNKNRSSERANEYLKLGTNSTKFDSLETLITALKEYFNI
jgi:hypothetical protein